VLSIAGQVVTCSIDFALVGVRVLPGAGRGHTACA
jgi:hypothetical protein